MAKFLLDLLSQASVLIALFTMAGLIFLKKSPGDILMGTVKAMAGFLILGAGGGVITAALSPFGVMITHAFKVEGLIPSNEAILAFAFAKHGAQASLIMISSLGIHLLIARFTPIKFIFLSGHLTFYMSLMLSIILSGFGLAGGAVTLAGALACALAMSFSPLITHWAMPKIGGKGTEFGLAQFSNLSYGLAALIGLWFGKGSPSTEGLRLPKNLEFFRDTTSAVAVTMVLLYVICALAAGQAFIESQVSGGQHYLVFAVISAVTFAAGVAVLFLGINMVITEILPAFKGISDRLVPNAIPALDCPVLFPYAPNAVLLGFVCSLAGGFSGMALQSVLHMTVVIPGIVAHFFAGATAGIFGNATGGRRGCMLGAYTHGLLCAFLPLLLLPFMGEYQNANTIFSDPDFAVTGAGLGHLLLWLKP